MKVSSIIQQVQSGLVAAEALDLYGEAACLAAVASVLERDVPAGFRNLPAVTTLGPGHRMLEGTDIRSLHVAIGSGTGNPFSAPDFMLYGDQHDGGFFAVNVDIMNPSQTNLENALVVRNLLSQAVTSAITGARVDAVRCSRAPLFHSLECWARSSSEMLSSFSEHVAADAIVTSVAIGRLLRGEPIAPFVQALKRMLADCDLSIYGPYLEAMFSTDRSIRYQVAAADNRLLRLMMPYEEGRLKTDALAHVSASLDDVILILRGELKEPPGTALSDGLLRPYLQARAIIIADELLAARTDNRWDLGKAVSTVSRDHAAIDVIGAGIQVGNAPERDVGVTRQSPTNHTRAPRP